MSDNLSKKFIKHGYVIVNLNNKSELKKIKNLVLSSVIKNTKLPTTVGKRNLLDNFHKFIKIEELNQLRLNIINEINKNKNFKNIYYNLVRNHLEELVGNELAIQNRINLSIQLPKDDSSLLPLHADTWAGDSPFEVVVWIPMVNCYKTKSMFILDALKYEAFLKLFKKNKNRSSEHIYQKIKKDLKFLKINYGQALIFNQALPHGNRINEELATRWSFNCRFKGLFTPYGDKKLGEFFQPLSIKPATKIGMKYKLPNI
ncbi:2OG-Fe(II) oxygenase [Pelagibacteraceae bacterium]|nr:2OG-Fe(II) oxygenase [Pelagibacteraceae bacterium]